MLADNLGEKLDSTSPLLTERILSIDLFRGLLVSLMILVNFFLYFGTIPAVLKHAPPLRGITIVDFGAPLFFFLIGISYAISLEKRRARDGIPATILHFVRRYVLFWLFGLVGVFVTDFRLAFGWNVLMAIGLAGIYALPLMFLSPLWRFITGLALLVFYQLVILKYYIATVIAYDMGGYLGALAWAGLLLISSVWWPIMKSKKPMRAVQLMLVALLTAALVGFVANASALDQANKPIISFSYILFSYSLAVFTLLVFYLVERYSRLKLTIFRPLGRNALLLYMLSGVLGLLLETVLRPDAPLVLILLSSLVIYFACFLVAFYLERKKLFIKIQFDENTRDRKNRGQTGADCVG